MSTNKSTTEPAQRQAKKREHTLDDVAPSKPVDDAVSPPEWFEARDARNLLNAMPRKLRKGPAPKPLTRD